MSFFLKVGFLFISCPVAVVSIVANLVASAVIIGWLAGRDMANDALKVIVKKGNE